MYGNTFDYSKQYWDPDPDPRAHNRVISSHRCSEVQSKEESKAGRISSFSAMRERGCHLFAWGTCLCACYTGGQISVRSSTLSINAVRFGKGRGLAISFHQPPAAEQL